MKYFKKTLKLLTVASLLFTPLLQSALLTNTKVYIKNNTKDTWTIYSRLENKQSVNFLTWKPKKEKTTIDNKKIVIKPGKKKKILTIDRNQLTPVGYGRKDTSKPMPFEEWITELVNSKNPRCKIAVTVRSQHGKLQKSAIGKSFEILAKKPHQFFRKGELLLLDTTQEMTKAKLSPEKETIPEVINPEKILALTSPLGIPAFAVSIIAMEAAATGTALAGGLLAAHLMPITASIDLIDELKKQISSIGLKYTAGRNCNIYLSDKSKPGFGQLYKNIVITIDPKPTVPSEQKPQTSKKKGS